MQREINYTRKPLIYGNSCKVNALFNKGAHPRPSLFEEKCKFETIKNHRENQRNQNNQRGQDKNYQKPPRKPKQQKQTNFQPHVGQSGHGSESFVFFCFFGFPDGF